MATTPLDPLLLPFLVFPIVLFVIHHIQDVESALFEEHSTDHAIQIVSHIENDTVADPVRRPERLLQIAPVRPGDTFGDLVPGGHRPFGDLGVVLPRFPESTKSRPRDDPQTAPIGCSGSPGDYSKLINILDTEENAANIG